MLLPLTPAATPVSGDIWTLVITPDRSLLQVDHGGGGTWLSWGPDLGEFTYRFSQDRYSDTGAIHIFAISPGAVRIDYGAETVASARLTPPRLTCTGDDVCSVVTPSSVFTTPHSGRIGCASVGYKLLKGNGGRRRTRTYDLLRVKQAL
jgi:hypothetical protein